MAYSSLRGAAFSAFMMLAGCVHVGERFDPAAVNELRPGIASKEEAIGLLGNPISISTDPHSGDQLLIWSFVHSSGLIGADAASVGIIFDPTGKMMRVSNLGVVH